MIWGGKCSWLIMSSFYKEISQIIIRGEMLAQDHPTRVRSSNPEASGFPFPRPHAMAADVLALEGNKQTRLHFTSIIIASSFTFVKVFLLFTGYLQLE